MKHPDGCGTKFVNQELAADLRKARHTLMLQEQQARAKARREKKGLDKP